MDNIKKFLKNLFKDKRFIIMLVILVVLIVAGIILYNVRYSPTSETMTLEEYYEVADGETAIIIDGELISKTDGTALGLVRNNKPYVQAELINDFIKDVYAYDEVGHTVCYTTKEGTYKANAGSKGYTFNGQSVNKDYVPFIEEAGRAYISLAFIKDSNGTDYTFNENPARTAIYTAGKERTTATVRKDTPMRRFGGNRSKILSTAKEGEEVTIVDNYGSWSQILTEEGVLGCVENGYLKDKETNNNKTGAAQEELNHNLMKEKIRMGWHQILNNTANDQVSSVISVAEGMNVISPTWIQIKDNKGNINDMSSASYVQFCHDKNIKVWSLVSNIEKDVDEGSLFKVAQNRENLINNIINSVTAVGADGINVDMESVGDANVDGYVEFIKELALKCKEKGLVLSVDNYNIDSANYKVGIQSRYADYIVLFGYDETWTGSPTAGSNNSMGFVKEGVEDMLDEGVDKNRLILAIPFYTRLWTQTGQNVTSETVSLKDTPDLLAKNNATPTWIKENKENYAEWQKGDGKCMIWIVDDKSLKERCDYAMSKNIAGISAWKLGYETVDTWKMIKDTVK
ncbi:MAG: hypothetical protein E7279_02775 [Lachnospiraceae bacterium]|nr:hypothetical protein [Lachnospiraceae bacterium]